MKRMKVNVRGIPVSIYEVAGEGPQTGLFLHGVGGTAKMWAAQMRALKACGRMISVDIPGFVGDKWPTEIVSLSQYVGIMTGVLDAREVDKAVWVGNSLGGRISIETALTVPERVAGLGLLCSAGVFLGAERERIPTDISKEQFDQAVFYLPERFAGVQTDESKRQNLEGRRRYEDLAERTDVMNFRDRLSEIDVPTRVIWGRHDGVTKVHIGEYIAEHIAGAKLLILEEAAHVPQVEQPLAVTEELRGLFAEAAVIKN
ncbi:alpha/beta fold hydrolase [Tumebacillus flagellatus]|uniref:alpha/beta fold hydrolase n=1 Tax=Tumebacillus flagellatus TaxID=1157490 RepID=UPI001EE673DB|nr:alpha/beta fold hydrolase [Tumebacillus flagellatus]